ncbi:hypothetical protein MPL3365_170112 [Mesorhizobium plurifarium]|uniref:Uncharacterized protein n=1 Tax=Mesorhizobium plurifarium TaxID=69974 RepID=A0A090G5J7_MESPL|nr:hypothetical protein MPL3365_170112 [Mesorhizobium plurifarium]
MSMSHNGDGLFQIPYLARMKIRLMSVTLRSGGKRGLVSGSSIRTFQGLTLGEIAPE